MKQQEHQRAVEKMLEQRRQQFAKQQEREMEEIRQQEKMLETQKKIIEEERQRILKEHAPKLVGYLPKGVIRDERDLEMLGSEFRDAYNRQNATNAT
jgi:vacuolar-type H+-ATPase subunit H